MELQVREVSRRPAWPLWAVGVVLAWLALVGAGVALGRILGASGPACLFKLTTGLPCPTCGLTRGTLALLAGRPVRAWLFNPLMFTLLGVLLAAVTIRAVFARRVTVRLTRRERHVAWVLAAVALLGNWLYVIRFVG